MRVALRKFGWLLLGSFAAGLGIIGWGGVTGLPGPSLAIFSADDGERLRFGFCHTGGGTNCVVDGDTIWMHGEKIRIADIDAPETHPPRCAEEKRLGEAATKRLQDLLNAGPVTLEVKGRATDRYGRKLRIVIRDGESLGARLVDEGLARRWTGRRQPWCDAPDPDFSAARRRRADPAR
ncbi:thermonuclease family protein [Sphingomonas sp. HF-S3]|uniref:Thermonuclease family protein n=1 Tax=Sphingomonas rustica TaxID=3103142 RepID=A0ABV0BDH9_9SPHN